MTDCEMLVLGGVRGGGLGAVWKLGYVGDKNLYSYSNGEVVIF